MSSDQPAARYERKYLLQTQNEAYLTQLVMLHQAGFKEIYYPRIINNIYFDNQNFSCFKSNQAGDSQRFKVRLRWYTDKYLNYGVEFANEAITPHLEIKLKQADLVTKYIFKHQEQLKPLLKTLPNFLRKQIKFTQDHELSNDVSLTEIKNKQAWKSLVSKAGYLQPVLFNAYQRRYFITSDQKIRLTIDSRVRFHQISSLELKTNQGWSLPVTIIEMKTSLANGELLSKIAEKFPFQLTRSSKYSMGINCCYLPEDHYQLDITPQPIF